MGVDWRGCHVRAAVARQRRAFPKIINLAAHARRRSSRSPGTLKSGHRLGEFLRRRTIPAEGEHPAAKETTMSQADEDAIREIENQFKVAWN